MLYQLLNAASTAVLQTETRRCIYLDQPSTIHTETYLQWVADGGVADPYIAPPAPAKEEIQAQKWTAIKSERDRRTQAGVAVGANWFHSDTFSRTQQLGLTMMGASMPAGIMWKTMSGSFVEMTPTLAGQIFQATAASDSALFAVAEAKHAEMLALADPTDYDVTAGWPATYTA